MATNDKLDRKEFEDALTQTDAVEKEAQTAKDTETANAINNGAQTIFISTVGTVMPPNFSSRSKTTLSESSLASLLSLPPTAWAAFHIASAIFFWSKSAIFPLLFFIFVTVFPSILSYVVNRFPHFRHSLLLLLIFKSSVILLSRTLVSFWEQ